MDDARARLVRCFQAVFPELSEAQALKATTARVGAWDSVATATLVAVVEEEFGLQFPADAIETLRSFDAFLMQIERDGTRT